ncbi:hypothetical protein C8R42DRAFT_640180 [Lentinula raphanica]|nr:hypothetical protein C8R42DRAFT_640180 [Lentinula raphanica]
MARSTASRVLLISFVGAAISSGVLAAPAPQAITRLQSSDNPLLRPLAPKPGPFSVLCRLEDPPTGENEKVRNKPGPKPKTQGPPTPEQEQKYDELKEELAQGQKDFEEAESKEMTLKERVEELKKIRGTAYSVEQELEALPIGKARDTTSFQATCLANAITWRISQLHDKELEKIHF